jgi:hypothetical protein
MPHGITPPSDRTKAETPNGPALLNVMRRSRPLVAAEKRIPPQVVIGPGLVSLHQGPIARIAQLYKMALVELLGRHRIFPEAKST